MSDLDMIVGLLHDFWLRSARNSAKRKKIFELVRQIRIRQAEKAFREMEASGARPFVHILERKP